MLQNYQHNVVFQGTPPFFLLFFSSLAVSLSELLNVAFARTGIVAMCFVLPKNAHPIVASSIYYRLDRPTFHTSNPTSPTHCRRTVRTVRKGPTWLWETGMRRDTSTRGRGDGSTEEGQDGTRMRQGRHTEQKFLGGKGSTPMLLINHLATRTRAGLHWHPSSIQHLITPLLQPVTTTAYQSSPACFLPPDRSKPVTSVQSHSDGVFYCTCLSGPTRVCM